MFTCFVQLVQLNFKIMLHECIEKAYTARPKQAEVDKNPKLPLSLFWQ